MSSYCTNHVKHHDYDRYLCALLAPAAARNDLIALAAFNIEVASIPEQVSQPTLGLVRLQWWRQTLEEIDQGLIPDHPVAKALAKTIIKHDLSPAHFQALLDARTLDMEEESPPTMEALEAYAEGTSSTLIALALEILGIKDDVASEAARLVGISWALAGLLRALPFHARTRRLYLPQDMCKTWSVSTEAIFAGRPCPALTRVTSEIATIAQARLDQARALRPQVPRQALAALLPATLSGGYLKKLKGHGFDPFRGGTGKASVGMLMALLFHAIRGRY